MSPLFYSFTAFSQLYFSLRLLRLQMNSAASIAIDANIRAMYGAIGVSSPVFTDVVFFVSDSVSVSVSVLVMVTCASVFASLSVTEVLST